MMEPYELAQWIAWTAGLWNLLVAGWLVFLADRRTPLLEALALTQGLLGGTVYLVIRRPPWAWSVPYEDELVMLVVLLFGVFSVLVTLIVWRAFDLEAPLDTIRRHVKDCREFFSF